MISRIAQKPLQPANSTNFGRYCHVQELDGIVKGDAQSIVFTCDLIGRNVIKAEDGALGQLSELARRHPKNQWVSAVKFLLERKETGK